MVEKVEDVVKDTIFPRIDKLYDGINDLRNADASLGALGDLGTILGNFKREVSKNRVDEATKELLERQYANAERLMSDLEGFYSDFKEMRTPSFNVSDARKHVSNLHLVFNALCDLAREVDRNYVKKPQLLCGDLPECAYCKRPPEPKEGND